MVKFGYYNILPSDYSFVVWASKTPVTIDVKTHDHGESATFPTYKLSDSVKLYDFKGNLIDREGESGGNDDWVRPDDFNTDGFTLPHMVSTSATSFHDKFKFAESDNDFTSSITMAGETKFQQQVKMTLEGFSYFFT